MVKKPGGTGTLGEEFGVEVWVASILSCQFGWKKCCYRPGLRPLNWQKNTTEVFWSFDSNGRFYFLLGVCMSITQTWSCVKINASLFRRRAGGGLARGLRHYVRIRLRLAFFQAFPD